MIDIIYPLIGLIICTSIVVFFVKKKREHKDFYAVVITTIFLGILCLLLTIWETEDYVSIKNKKFQTYSGECVVTEFESTGRTSIHELHVEIKGDLVVFGDFDDFRNVKQGTYQCTVKYIEKSRTLYDIKSQSPNE